MSDRLKPGEQLTTSSGQTVVVDEYLASGGQGDVYRVKTPHGDMALKWYFDETATPAQRDNLERLVEMGHDDPRFLWPEAFIASPSGPRFGYVMSLRPPGFATIPDLLARRVKGANLRSLFVMGIGLAEAFRSLHARGLAYRDISWGNVFFEPGTGRILIPDNDNAVFADEEAEIGGTLMFMAPELIRGEVPPGVLTDLHSLAVLLFMIFVNGHPFEGKLESEIMSKDEEADRQLYGSPVFLFDPDDSSNRPVPGIHDPALQLWPSLPSEVKELFVTTFTAGAESPSQRATEWSWARTLSKVYDSLYTCPGCQRTNVIDQGQFTATGVVGACWSCQAALPAPLQLAFGKRQLVLDPSAKIFGHHLSESGEHSFDEPIAEMVAHPSKPGKFGLKNCGPHTWTAVAKDGSLSAVSPSGVVSIRKGLDLQIENTKFTLVT